jgi:hypothetical protein
MAHKVPSHSDPDFVSIDDPNIHWPPFMLSMLQVGRILTRRTLVRHGMTAQQISSAMVRHRHKVGMEYRPREIRELIGNYLCYFTGGGIKVEAQQVSSSKFGPDYSFTFSRILKPEDYAMPQRVENKQEAQN